VLFADTFMIQSRGTLPPELSPGSNSITFQRTICVRYAEQARMSFSVVTSLDMQRDPGYYISKKVPEHLDSLYFDLFLRCMSTPDGRTK
jgi:hypothetical protein